VRVLNNQHVVVMSVRNWHLTSVLVLHWTQYKGVNNWIVKYCKILLIQLAQDQAGANLSITLNYQKETVLTQVLTGTFGFCSYIWCVQLIRGVFHLDISFICWFKVIRVLFYVLWSLHSWRSWWNRKIWVSRYHNCWHTDTWRLFWTYPKDMPVSLM